eukprot:scaffold30644_cov67-Phaeocystis_antarctica.AAC.4
MGVPLLRGQVQCRHPVAVGCGDGRAVRHEKRDHRRVALLGGKVQRRAAVRVGRSRRGASLTNQSRAHAHVTLESGKLQRRHPIFIRGLG